MLSRNDGRAARKRLACLPAIIATENTSIVTTENQAGRARGLAARQATQQRSGTTCSKCTPPHPQQTPLRQSTQQSKIGDEDARQRWQAVKALSFVWRRSSFAGVQPQAPARGKRAAQLHEYGEPVAQLERWPRIGRSPEGGGNGAPDGENSEALELPPPERVSGDGKEHGAGQGSRLVLGPDVVERVAHQALIWMEKQAPPRPAALLDPEGPAEDVPLRGRPGRGWKDDVEGAPPSAAAAARAKTKAGTPAHPASSGARGRAWATPAVPAAPWLAP